MNRTALPTSLAGAAPAVEAPDHVPAVLLMAHYAGTLAGVRCLGSYGVPVVIATSEIFAPARWSRWVTRIVRAPRSDARPTTLLKYLVRFGRKHPGAVLYPTSDDLAWLIARHADELSRYYYLYSPPVAAMRSVLDKAALYRACTEVGIDTPETLYPKDERELRSLVTPGERYVIKPRTQTFLRRHPKGGVARDIDDLIAMWREYRAEPFAPELSADWPEVGYPLVQRFVPSIQGVHSVSGFIDRSGRVLASRGCVKVLQEPSHVGIGICFEDAVPEPGLIDRIAALCKKVGYYGMFEAEYIRSDGRQLLIDFNPRYFGQMGFDIARGVPLAWMAHVSALGREDLAEAAARSASATNGSRPHAYSDEVTLRFRLGTGRVARLLSAEQAEQWRRWLEQNASRRVDAALSLDDVKPGVAAVAWVLWRTLRHPRVFWRSLR